MKQNYTHLVLVLDKSGSMGHLQQATIEGVNSLVAAQKDIPGTITTSLYTFDGNVQEVKNFDLLTTWNYVPSGSTALLDAVAEAITKEGERLSAKAEQDRPDRVVFVIITDGEENTSKVAKLEDVKNTVKHQQDIYKWQFVFLGANIDAFAAGSKMNFAAVNSRQFVATPDGVRAAYCTTSQSLGSYRTGVTKTVDMTGPDAVNP